MDINLIVSIVSIVLSIYAIVQSSIFNKNSEKLNSDTEKQLLEIKNLSDNIIKTSDRIENNINTQVNRIINSNAPTQDEKMQQQLMSTVLPSILKNPELIEKLSKLQGNK